jgi:GNAT superfamily N-acetyltransferase
MGLPPSLAEQGIKIRPESPADFDFLETLYIAVRWPELEQAPWTEDAKLNFLRHQFSLQYAHYNKYYAETDFGILEHNQAPIGRWYVFRGASDLRIVDVSLMPNWRNKGITTAMFDYLFEEADALNKSVSIHVEQFNPAKNLYLRLGFQPAGESGPYILMIRQPNTLTPEV